MNIAVVDDGGNLVAFVAMDGTKLIGEDISQKKALTRCTSRWTPRTSRRSCSRVSRCTASRPRRAAASSSSAAACCCDRRRAPSRAGVGVSAGSVDEDHQVAAAERPPSAADRSGPVRDCDPDDHDG
jgi:uncharacterized protein GlcG (DUF336 family)